MLKKKKLVLIAAAIILTLTLILLILPKTQTPSSVALPQSSIKPYYTAASSPAVNFNQLSSFLPAKALPIFIVPMPDQNQLIRFFQPIADGLKLQVNPKTIIINSVSFLSWADPNSYLNVNLETGQFSLKLGLSSAVKTADINEIDALNVARTWLEKSNLISSESSSVTSYLDKKGQELSPQASPSPGSYFQFDFTPKFNNQPVFSTLEHSFSPVTIIVSNQGQIFYVNFQLPVLSLDSDSLNSQVIKLKTLAQINQEVAANKPIITLAESQPGIYQAGLGQPKNINYQQIIPGYQFVRRENQNLFLPILQLKGTADLDNKQQVYLTAFLPLIQE